MQIGSFKPAATACVTALVMALAASQQVSSTPVLTPQAHLDEAIACAEENKDLAASFTLSFTQKSGASVSHRYDAQEDTWTFLSGDLASLDKRGRQSFENISQEMGQPGGLVPRDLKETILNPALVDETDDALVYSFLPGAAEGEDPMPEAMVEALETRVYLDKETSCMSGMSMKSRHPFKPSPIVKMESFEFAYTFGRPGGSAIPLIEGFQSAVSGSALLSKFDAGTTVKITEVEILSAG